MPPDEIRRFDDIFLKKSNGSNGILRVLGETDSWKNLMSIISWHCPITHTPGREYADRQTDRQQIHAS
jgi:hypothetical protein